jgi:hypothetical protein
MLLFTAYIRLKEFTCTQYTRRLRGAERDATNFKQPAAQADTITRVDGRRGERNKSDNGTSRKVLKYARKKK